ncbi:MAG: permease-like cell division protein FtsX [Patescibacteria group bacterium]
MERIFRSGFDSFQRNPWLTTASVVMMTLVLVLVGGLAFIHVTTEAMLASFSEKIDISVYIKSDTAETTVLRVREELTKLSEVKAVEYVSQNEALARFKDTHKDNALILNSLAELEKNPLQATLNIKARETGQFEKISEYLSSKNHPFIDKINFYENRLIIERLSAIAGGVRSIGIAVILLFALIAIIIAFNTIRLAIYSKREEIQIMKLVGASHWYIRGPFVVEGVLQGVISTLIALAFLFPIAWVVSPKLSLFISGFDLMQYFRDNIFIFSAMLLVAGTMLGVSSSMIAMRRYLKEV